jgi:hypothetical protein
MREITIGKTVIGYEVFEKPYVIAEAGVNHEGELDIALKMIREAAEAGANAVKFQMYKAERLASRKSPAYWDQTKEPATSQYTLFKRYDRFGEEEFSRLAEEATKCGVDTIVTPFDCAIVVGRMVHIRNAMLCLCYYDAHIIAGLTYYSLIPPIASCIHKHYLGLKQRYCTGNVDTFAYALYYHCVGKRQALVSTKPALHEHLLNILEKTPSK